MKNKFFSKNCLTSRSRSPITIPDPRSPFPGFPKKETRATIAEQERQEILWLLQNPVPPV